MERQTWTDGSADFFFQTDSFIRACVRLPTTLWLQTGSVFVIYLMFCISFVPSMIPIVVL